MSISELFRTSGASLPGISPTDRSGEPGKSVGIEAKKPGGASEFQKLLDLQSQPTGEPAALDRVAKDSNTRPALNFSQHAETRIRSRLIPWDAALEKRISDGLDAAHKKGSREALILAGDVAVIANVKSRTIVTAMERGQMKDRIFTNIDSAVLV